MSSYCYIYVLILLYTCVLYICPHTAIYVRLWGGVSGPIYVSSYCYMLSSCCCGEGWQVLSLLPLLVQGGVAGGGSKKECSTCFTSAKVPILTLGTVAGGVAGVAGGLEKEMLKAAKEMQRALHL